MVTMPSSDLSVTSETLNSFRWFEHLGVIADLDKAITAQQQATRFASGDHSQKPGYLSNLGTSFLHQFECLGEVVGLDEAITVQQQAVRLTPDGHHDKAAHLNNLGKSFRARLMYHYDNATFAQVINAYSQSTNSSSRPPSHRFSAVRVWAMHCFLDHSNETLDAYSTLIDLLSAELLSNGTKTFLQYMQVTP
jgi:hypothetical protein